MTNKSPNLEVVSKESGDRGYTERRRLPRLRLNTGQFRLQQNGKIFSVVDLSQAGMALGILESADLAVFPVGMHFEGTLNFRGEKHRLKATVRHVGHTAVGCEFEDLETEVSDALKIYLSPESLGQELRPIPSSESGAIWYHGSSGADLLFWRGTDGQYQRVVLYLLGQYIQWDDEKGLATGVAKAADEQGESWGLLRYQTLLLKPDDKPDPEKLSIAKKVILSSKLPEDLKNWCSRHFKR